MYVIITNMERHESPLDGHVFCVLSHCSISQFRDLLESELGFYYAMYNHKHVKVATFKDREFFKSGEYKHLSKHMKNLHNIERFVNYGGKNFDWKNLLNNTIPKKERLLGDKKFTEILNEYISHRWINELVWE